MVRRLFHLSPIDNLDSIKEKGLLLNEDGELFLLDEAIIKYYMFGEFKVSELIAWNQLFLEEYLMIEVEVEIDNLEMDNVAEITRDYQYISYEPISVNCIKNIEFANCRDYINKMIEFHKTLEEK